MESERHAFMHKLLQLCVETHVEIFGNEGLEILAADSITWIEQPYDQFEGQEDHWLLGWRKASGEPMSLPRRALLLDTETTGLDPSKDVIIEVACILYDLAIGSPIASFSALARSDDQRRRAHQRHPRRPTLPGVRTGARLGRRR